MASATTTAIPTSGEHGRPPAGCNLSPEALPARLDAAAALGARALLDVETSNARALLRFASRDSVAKGVEAFVAAESECCSFFDFSIQTGSDEIELTVQAPDDLAPALRALVAAVVDGWNVRA